jgi:hypothetical protein
MAAPTVEDARDGFVFGLLALMLAMLAAALTGAYRVFGYALVVFLGMLMGLGFVRRRDLATWVPPVVATAVLLVSLSGMFAYESATVDEAADTILGFHPGTAFLVYGVWIPAFFTMGLSFALVFERLTEPGGSDPRGRDQTR